MDKPTVLQIAICEDVHDDAALLCSVVEKCVIPAQSHPFSSGEELLESFQAGMYDLVFMDIYMKGMTGIETVEAIRNIDENVTIAFTTSSPDHTLEGYKLDVHKYIVKPVTEPKNEKDVNKALEQALMKKKNRPSITIVLAGGERTEVFLDTIMYFEHKNRVIELHTAERIMVTSQSARLDALERQLPSPPFLRCHRSYLVNLDYVDKTDKELNAFRMKNGDRADVRQGGLAKCGLALKEWRLHKAGKAEG